jgi:hypothetical protein
MLPWTNACIPVPFPGDPDGADAARESSGSRSSGGGKVRNIRNQG